MDFLNELLEDAQHTVGGSNIRCDTCGSSLFFSEDGFFFCSDCLTQSQDTRQYIEEEEFVAGRLNSGPAGILRTEKTGASTSKKRDWIRLSVWEVRNYCLKVIVDRLIEIGVPATLKAKILELWSAYLIKTKAIFVSESHPDILTYYTWDGIKSPRKKSKKVNLQKLPEIDENLLSVSDAKRKRTLAQRKAIEKDYVDSKLIDSDELETPTKLLPKLKKIPQRHLTNEQSYLIRKWKNQSGLSQSDIPQLNLRAQNFTLVSLFALIFIATRQIGCRILYTDLLRMASDGTLYISSIRLLLDEDFSLKFCGKDEICLNTVYLELIDVAFHLDSINTLVEYLGMKSFRYPTFQEFLPKFIDDFALPREMECLAYQMENIHPFIFEDKYLPKPIESLIELKILSLFIVLLKLLFGLDDVTEKFQSEFARTVNNVIAEISSKTKKVSSGEEWIKLFEVDDWLAYLRYREEVVHSELLSATYYSPLKTASKNRVNSVIGVFAGHKGDNPDPRRNEEEIKRKTILNMFGNYARQQSSHEVIATPSYLTIPLPKETVTHQYKTNYPNVNYPNYKPNLLQRSFLKDRIDFVYFPEKYIKLLEKAGYKVTVLQGDAREYKPHTSRNNSFKKRVVLFQPYKAFDDYSRLLGSSCSLNLVYNLCESTFVGPQANYGNIRSMLANLTGKIGEFYSKSCKSGHLTSFPYSYSSSEEKESSNNESNDLSDS